MRERENKQMSSVNLFICGSFFMHIVYQVSLTLHKPSWLALLSVIL